MYNPETDTWVSKDSINTPRFGLQSIEMDGRIYIFGECINNTFNAINSIEMYDIKSNTWSTSGSLSFARGLLGASVIDNSVFIFGGLNTSSAYYDTTEQNIFQVIVPTLTAAAANKQVTLNWTAVEGATCYSVKRSTTPGGPYDTIASNIQGTIYADNDVVNGTTYYYVVTAIVNEVESPNSNEVSATPTGTEEPPVITGNKAILEIVMTNGTIKEYDLTAQEIENFLKWYDSRSAGTDKAYISIIKRSNVKPFVSRNEYLQFKEIYSFEVKEYKE